MDLPYNVRNALQCSKDKDVLWGSVDGITSETTHDLCEDLQNDSEGSKAPELPRLPTRHAIPTSKKRDREEYLASSSDPPLFSSDDLPSSSADNYLEQRHKRQYQRSWFEPEDLSNLSTGSKSSPVTVEERSSRAKIRSSRGPFTRAFDSGVWMGSDETEENDVDLHEDIGKNTQAVPDFEAFGDEDIDLAEEACALSQTPEEDRYGALVHKAMQTIEDPNDFDGPVFPYWQKQPNYLQAFHSRQELAQKRVSECIDKGAEDLDLS